MDDSEVTEDELNLSLEWDSRNFGEKHFLPDGDKYKLLKRLIEYYRDKIKDSEQAKPIWLLRLGHFHLLCLEWHLALSAYTKCMKLSKWEDHQFRVIKEPQRTILRANKNAKSGKTLLLYGLGLCYFHFSNFLWAKKTFLEVLYREPEFHCAVEVHARLGLTLKYLGLLNWSRIHLNWALENSSQNSDDFRGPMTVAEIKFHLGHVCELQKRHHDAKKYYQQVINEESKTREIESACHTTLGWMLFRCPTLGEKEERIRQAISHLTRATQIDDQRSSNSNSGTGSNSYTNGQSWYYLGRCYSTLRDVNAAFNHYRKSIDKSEACADTWCSIGVLYQEQKQHMDALQAFICAVQLDPNHQEAWKDLGVLYEAKGQYHDAFICYRKSVDCRPGADDQNLINRSKILQDQEPPMINQTKLPSIEEAWTLPIPAELTQRQTVRRATRRNIHQELKKYKKMWSGHENNDTENDSTSSESNEPTISSSNPNPNDSSSSAHPSWLPSQDEAKVLEHLQQSSHSLTPHQQSEMERLKFGQFAVEYHKRNQKSSRVPDPNNETNNMETVDFEPFSESTDYGMEVSAIRGRRTPGICSPTEFSHIVTANELINTCQKLRQLLEKDTKLEIENKSSPYIPEITEKEVNCNPETPMVQIDNKKEASSKALSDLCCNNRIPAILIRGMCQVLRLDLGFFSTRSFSQVAGQNKVNVYTQKKDPSSRWSLDEKMSISTLRNYADYQASTFRDALKDDSKKEKRKNQKNPKNPKVAVKMSIFELSDEQFQINMGEIQKLPNFMKFYSVQNYLSYSDLPSNKLNVYFFIPNCKLKPKQHYFNKVSINVGPGDFEWFIVPEWHWAQVEEILLIHKKNLYDCWWPNLEIFQKYNIPIYRLVQKPGDILWIQSGSITWGHALGWCNSIMYNVSQLTAHSYQIAMENYERSIIYSKLPECPMMYISWNICRLIRLTDFRFYSQLKFFLQRSIWSLQVQSDFIKERKIDTIQQKKSKIHFCQSCKKELFVFIWVKRKEDDKEKRRAFCQICALRSNRDVRNWCVLQQSSLDELHSSFNKFNFQKN